MDQFSKNAGAHPTAFQFVPVCALPMGLKVNPAPKSLPAKGADDLIPLYFPIAKAAPLGLPCDDSAILYVNVS